MGGIISCGDEERLVSVKEGDFVPSKRRQAGEQIDTRDELIASGIIFAVTDVVNCSIEEDEVDDQLHGQGNAQAGKGDMSDEEYDGFRTKTIEELLEEKKQRLIEKRNAEARKSGVKTGELAPITEEEVMEGYTKGKGYGELNASNLNATMLAGNQYNSEIPEYAEEDSNFLAQRAESDVMSELTEEEEEEEEQVQEKSIVVQEIIYNSEDEKEKDSDDEDEEQEVEEKSEVTPQVVIPADDPFENLRKKERYFRDVGWNLKQAEERGIAPRLSVGSPSRVKVYDMTDFHPDRERASAKQPNELLANLLTQPKIRNSYSPLWPLPSEW
eukprot:CAMPEP_0115017040 /NCGR_PEP_ID=MMETSP0216-20121206/27856_1 /TAXON_ID=223996 /ORGANISM="Protocruzia adherens, Strain Boccale" /LENGTH=327 /DNA_ID=CAMNT_0002387733 /DNA_START=158 /DNA_END=1138 /DNA_ORIENTATION=+